MVCKYDSLFFHVLVDSKHECLQKFGKQPNARAVNDDDQLCTTEYSRIVPLENGEVKYHVKQLYQITNLTFSEVSKRNLYEMNAVLCRLWCLWSTDGQVPKTSPTHQCCETLQRPQTSACTFFAPTPCWVTSSPRLRETPQSHAG